MMAGVIRERTPALGPLVGSVRAHPKKEHSVIHYVDRRYCGLEHNVQLWVAGRHV
jgi:hypothetical protein